MNLFRFLGDLSHLLAIILLLLKIWKSRSCAGISGKSQVLFAVVFTARYLDLFTNYISLYNTCMKVVYIACSFTTVWMIYSKFKATYDGNHDTFRVEFLVVPTAILAFLVNHDFTPLEGRFRWICRPEVTPGGTFRLLGTEKKLTDVCSLSFPLLRCPVLLTSDDCHCFLNGGRQHTSTRGACSRSLTHSGIDCVPGSVALERTRCRILSLMELTLVLILWTFSIYRTLYLFNWIWRYHFEGFFDLIAIVAGLVQTVLYCDFFYLYITKVLKGKKLSLPA
uniref:KDEL endoplasmic reticulum protein retention receptor 1 n=1 Tax=Ailuropoda melanoleuca TaxID=9646 RepID=A0A7N5K286_AILME